MSVAPAACRRSAPLGKLAHGLRHRPRRLRANLDFRQERLVVDPLTRQPGARQDPVGHVRELQRVRVDEQQLLLERRPRRARPRRSGAAAEAPVRRLAHGGSPSAARAAIRPNTSAAASPLA